MGNNKETWEISGMPMGKRSQSRVERVPRSLEVQCPVCNARVGQECFKRWKGDDARHSYERPRNVYA